MRYVLARLALVPVLGGCSLIYNESNIPTPVPDAVDAEIDAQIVADADPSMLVLSDVDPKVILEGQGTGGSRQAIVIVSGNHIVDGATVAIAPAAGTVNITQGAVIRAANGDFLAIPITVAIDTPASGEIPLTITVTQPNGAGVITRTVEGLKLRYLPQMTVVPTTSMFEPLYSQINVPGATVVNLAGTERALFRAVGSITLPPLDGDGNDAAGTAAGTAELGGCAGGNPSSMGGCAGGGALGVSGTLGGGGGGGAGFATMGMSGTGTGAGQGGPASGDEMIVAYEALGLAANKPSGGGGGGAPVVGTGGGGGAGAGFIELTAGGDITVGAISVVGGTGGAGGGASSGGGGGAGGAVMLRAGGTLTALMITANGGPGGDVGSTDGGAGAAGRIRWDAPGGVAPPTSVPSVNRGPAFAIATELVYRETMPAITLVGKANVGFKVYTRHEGATYNQTTETFGSGGSVEIRPLLRGGYNELCITLNGGVQGTPEADKCIDVAFVP